MAVESQPFAFTRFAVYMPAVVMFWPFQVNGNWLLQILILFVLLLGWLMVRFRVAIESQPLVLVSVTLYVPELL